MQGTLDTFGVVEILQMLGRTRRSGTLHIECPQRLIDVHFSQGRIAETRDSTRVAADTVIGSLLLKRALISEQQLDDALAEQEVNPRPLGTILVEQGFLAQEALHEVLSRQVASTLVAAKLEAAGTFVFAVDHKPSPAGCITVDTQSVLLDISALGGEYCLAVELLGRPSTVLVLNADHNSLPRRPLLMGRDEFAVLLEVNGIRTVQEISEASGVEEITAMSILAKLTEAGVVLVKAARQPRGDVRELQAHRDCVWEEVSQLLDDIVDESPGAPAASGSAQAAQGAGDPGSAQAAPVIEPVSDPTDLLDQ